VNVAPIDYQFLNEQALIAQQQALEELAFLQQKVALLDQVEAKTGS
jgi:hypothetical protein